MLLLYFLSCLSLNLNTDLAGNLRVSSGNKMNEQRLTRANDHRHDLGRWGWSSVWLFYYPSFALKVGINLNNSSGEGMWYSSHDFMCGWAAGLCLLVTKSSSEQQGKLILYLTPSRCKIWTGFVRLVVSQKYAYISQKRILGKDLVCGLMYWMWKISKTNFRLTLLQC